MSSKYRSGEGFPEEKGLRTRRGVRFQYAEEIC